MKRQPHGWSAVTGSARGDTEPGEGDPRKWWALAVLAAVAFMAQLDLFVVNLAVPAIGAAFSGTGLSELSWVLNAYAVVFGALLVPAGRYADRYGRRRFLLVGATVFTAGSVVCAAAPTLPVLVAGRVVQAVGAAALLPTSLALLYPTFPRAQHATVVGVWAGVAAVAATAGPALGGLLVAVDWRWIFLINVPIGLAVVLGGRLVLRDLRAADALEAPSITSVVALLAAVGLVVLATVRFAEHGWTATLAMIAAAGAAAIVASVRATRRSARAVVDKALVLSPGFGVAAVALTLFFVAFGGWLLVGALFLQECWGYSALRTGLALAPGPLAAAIVALGSGGIVARAGRRLPAVVGPVCVAAAGAYWLVFTTTTPDYLGGFVVGQIVGGVGSGLTQAPLFAATSSLPARFATTGSAFLNMCRQVGSALGVALLVAVMALPATNVLAPYRAGWVLVTVAAVLAAAVQLVPTSRPVRTRPEERS